MRNVEGIRFDWFAKFDSFVTQKDTTLSLYSKNIIQPDKQQ